MARVQFLIRFGIKVPGQLFRVTVNTLVPGIFNKFGSRIKREQAVSFTTANILCMVQHVHGFTKLHYSAERSH